MARTVILERPPVFIDSSTRRQLAVTATGVGIGLFVFAVAWLLQHFFLIPAFCRDTYGGPFICGGDAGLAFLVSGILGAALGTVLLAHRLVYRPLLIAVAALATLWGFGVYLSGLSFGSIEQALWLMLLYGLTYSLFGWLLRFRHFAVGLSLTLVAVVILRIVLVAH